MKRPKQLPAVDRNQSTKSAAVPKGANVNPSGWFDDVVGAVTKTAPIWGPALGGLI
jgi:hypothetical protein